MHTSLNDHYNCFTGCLLLLLCLLADFNITFFLDFENIDVLSLVLLFQFLNLEYLFLLAVISAVILLWCLVLYDAWLMFTAHHC